MLKVRVIPVLLLKHWGLEKTIQFSDGKYVGCPINAARVFNNHNVDELILLDILATTERREPEFEVIQQIAQETTMPFTVGGGIRSLRTIQKLLNIGADRVVINSALVELPNFIKEASFHFGRQCIVASIDVRGVDSNKYEVFIHGGRTATGINPIELARRVEQEGAGEILINSIDRDGTMLGYDIELIEKITSNVRIPVIACGGAGSIQDFAKAFYEAGANAVAGGAIFLFYGKRRTVLITYPSEKDLLSYFKPEHIRNRDPKLPIDTELARL